MALCTIKIDSFASEASYVCWKLKYDILSNQIFMRAKRATFDKEFEVYKWFQIRFFVRAKWATCVNWKLKPQKPYKLAFNERSEPLLQFEIPSFVRAKRATFTENWGSKFFQFRFFVRAKRANFDENWVSKPFQIRFLGERSELRT